MMTEADRFDLERREDWRGWVEKIPSIKFPRSWEVTIIPPFGGAMARFLVNDRVSVYLDVFNALGWWTDDDGHPLPYWEVHPVDDDIWRGDMDDTAGLIKAISKSLRQSK